MKCIIFCYAAKKYNSAPLQGNETEVAAQTSDFAAFQRELARSLANPDSLDTEDSDPVSIGFPYIWLIL